MPAAPARRARAAGARQPRSPSKGGEPQSAALRGQTLEHRILLTATMCLLAFDGVAKVQSITAPLLAISFVLVIAVHIPHEGVSMNGARRWIGPGQLQFQPSELMKLALVLYSATLLARRPQRVHDLRELAEELLIVVGAACLLIFSQPDLGTALVIAFTVSAMLVAAGIPMQKLAIMGAAVCGL